MDYTDSFNPKPNKGERYTTKDGKVVIVDDIQPDEGVVYVFCHYEGDDPCTLYPNKEEWEAMFVSDDAPIGGDNVDTDTNDIGGDSDKTDKRKDDDSSKQNNSNNGDTDSSKGHKSDGTDSDTDIDSDKDVEDNVDEPSNDSSTNDLLCKILEPINRLRELLKNGVTLPFQILKLESDEEIPAPFSDPNLTKTCQEELNRIQKLRKEGEKEENYGSWIEEKMWSFGAFDKPMLRMFRQDHGAKTGLGAAIFMTALLACFTGTYAAYKISGNTFLAFIIGLVWGSMIYVLDRNIVTSMAYTGNKNKFQNFLKSICTVGLRLIISVFIGIVIAAPIEMLVFSGKIAEYKDFEHTKFVDDYLNKQVQHDYTKVGEIRQELDSLQNELEHEQYINPYGVSVLGRVYRGPRYYALEKEIKEKQAELKKWDDNISTVKKIDKIKYQKDAEDLWKEKQKFYDLSTDLAILYKVTAKVDEVNRGEDGTSQAKLSSENRIFGKSTNREIENSNTKASSKEVSDSVSFVKVTSTPVVVHNEQINPALPVDNTMYYCRIFITIFFTLLEVIPVITKLFFKAGDYDKMMVRWRYLNGKLQHIENASSYNQTINGPLSAHRKYILGEEFDDIDSFMQTDVNHSNEDKDDINDITLPVKGCLRTAKDYIEWRNLRRWKSTLEDVDVYLAAEIKKLFPQLNTPSNPSQQVQAQTPPAADDPSSAGEEIK